MVLAADDLRHTNTNTNSNTDSDTDSNTYPNAYSNQRLHLQPIQILWRKQRQQSNEYRSDWHSANLAASNASQAASDHLGICDRFLR